MIFAKIQYSENYESKHDEILSLLESRFDHVEGGLQCDSYIWVGQGKSKVAVDTFTAMTHEIKSSTKGDHVDEVIRTLQERYNIDIYQEAEQEAHED